MESLVNPETGKPNPLSIKEFMLMDRKEQRAFAKALTKQESFDFQAVVSVAYERLPMAKKVEYDRAKVAKLEARDNKSIPDKLELWMAKQQVKAMERRIASGKPYKESPWPKWIKDKKSPYLITAL